MKKFKKDNSKSYKRLEWVKNKISKREGTKKDMKKKCWAITINNPGSLEVYDLAYGATS